MGNHLEISLRNTIGIIIPAYNCEQHIGATLDSILAQTYKEWTVTVVNDGSTDKTEEILAKYAAAHSNIRYTTIRNTGSAHIPRLTAAQLSNEDWLCNIDADDTIEPRFLEKMITRAMETGADVVCPIMLYTTFSGLVFNQIPSQTFDFRRIYTGHEAARLTFQSGAGSLIATNGMLCRKELYTPLLAEMKKSRYVYQDEVDDLLLLLRAKYVVCCKAIYTYYRNEHSVTHTYSVKTYDKLLTEIEYNALIKTHFPERSIQALGDARFLDVILGRRMKYLSEEQYFNLEDRKKINSMFRTAYAHVRRSMVPSRHKLHIFFIGGRHFFNLITRLYYFIGKTKERP